MIWVTYRQHRTEVLSLAAVIAAMAVFLIVTGHVIGNWYSDNGVGPCLVATPPASCAGVVADFTSQFDTYVVIATLFAILPALAGIFIGAPLLAREFERNTHGLAWTQSVTRGRWLAVKLAALVGLGIVAAGVFTLMMTLWRGPFDQTGTRFADGFDVEGVVEFGYFLFALCLGALVGTIVRRTLPAMALTLVGFVAVRGPVEFWLRGHYMTPVTVTSNTGGNPTIPSDAWRLSSQFVDGSGNTLSRGQIGQLCGGGGFPERGSSVPSSCFSAHGIVRETLYQPADRFWSFQFIELGIFAALALACLALTVMWVRRRPG
jgi:hypothetical protein